MTNIILIDKTGNIKETTVKGLNTNKTNLYKKCGCKNPDDFEKRATWEVNINNEDIIIEMWARENGRANMENKYDFPPPCDTTLYFGTCAVIKLNENDEITNLTAEMWKIVYEKLFGGFEDIENEEDDEEEDELEDVPKEMKTKGGYLKDGFVVDTNSDEEIVSHSDDDDEIDEEEDDEVDEDEESDEDETGSELEEEEYNYSDED